MRPKFTYRVVPHLPVELELLQELAYNLCFSWKAEIRELFQRVDPELWEEAGHNPVLLLGLVSQTRLEELVQDPGFMAQLERVGGDFRRYVSHPRLQTSHYCPHTPFLVAYFSAEFGLARCLPIYSGGLGVLAGDHLKSASDLNIPLVGMGLLYQEGYFSQYLSNDGWQMERYPANDFHNMPLRPVMDSEGSPLRVRVDFKGQPVQIQIWRAYVGRIPLYLLDTNMEENPPDVRATTARLYGGDREMRLRQEIVLGVGGVRALKALALDPTVFHMNEGHSAFSALERIHQLRVERGLSFDAAREFVLATTVFTTHTPVPAGNDVFDPDLLRSYFEDYAKSLGIHFSVLLGCGRIHPQDEREPFGVTPLALRLSAHVNGVSRLHGKISRAMWQKVWPDLPAEDVPIEHITNGIHVPTWISRDMAALMDRYLGPDWAEDPDNKRVWEGVDRVTATELWRTHERCRERLVGYTRQRLVVQLKARGASEMEIQQAREVLEPDALTIGFARRFATYKRAALLFRDPDRLDRILNHPERPVQVVVAGKAHPQDHEGKELIRHIVHLARQERFRKRIVFIEDYYLDTAHHLMAGCDLWLNTPRRPLEACGTSGMKAMANGCLHMSTLDGWWDEGYDPSYGWAIGHGEEYMDHELQDEIESKDLYDLLENEVVPLFYQRGGDGIPRAWVDRMRSGLQRLVPIYNSHRMLQQYVERYYVPCSRRFQDLSHNDFQKARILADWRRTLMTSWQDVQILEVSHRSIEERKVGEEMEVTARIQLGSLTPKDVSVEIYYGRLDSQGEFQDRRTTPMKALEGGEEIHTYVGQIPCGATGRFGFTVRVIPSRDRLENPFTLALATWA